MDAPNYYAIIPASVRYDERLTANAKLLYGEITALSQKEGYCWAGDTYFCDLFKVGKTALQNWLKDLEDFGYIERSVIYKKGTKQIQGRYIKLTDALCHKGGAPMPDMCSTYATNVGSPMPDMWGDNITSNNNTKEYKDPSVQTSCTAKEIYTKRFDEFWRAYPRKIGKGDARKRYLKLKPNEELHQKIISAVMNQKQSDQWTRENGQFIPHPATWLNQERWEDEVEGKAKTGGLRYFDD